MRKALLAVASLICTVTASAQTAPQFTMHMYNRLFLNPAFAGWNDATTLSLIARSQWIGINGHPNTFIFSGHHPLPQFRSNIGGYIMGDYIGPISTTALRLSYAFRIPLGDQGAKIQLGVSPGVRLSSLDVGALTPRVQQVDPVLVQAQGNATNFDLGAGVAFFLPGEKLYVGISADHLLEPSLNSFLSGGTGDSRIPRHIYAQLGGKIDLRPGGTVYLQPNFNFRLVEGIWQFEANVNATISPMVFGISYRHLSDVMAIVGFHATRNLFIAYSYDYTYSGLSAATSGSHEVHISYTFPPVFQYRPENLDVKGKPEIR